MRHVLLPSIVWACWGVAIAQKAPADKVRYLRPSQNQFVTECEFVTRREHNGWTIESVTERGSTKLNLHSKYDRNDYLTAAQVTLTTGGKQEIATVEVTGGKAKVQRDVPDVQEFEVPKGVIVTSAPDWTDTFLLCQQFDRKRAGKQQFPGLWIHPTQPAQLLMFTIEKLGTDSIVHNGRSWSWIVSPFGCAATVLMRHGRMRAAE